MAISTQYGENTEFFGGDDYLAAKSQGISDTEILEYLNNNMGKIRGGNLPGGYFSEGKFQGPGVYERARQGAEIERSQQETRDAQRAFEERIAQQQSMFQDQLMKQQEEANKAQRQLMIQMQRPDRAPAEVKMAYRDDQQRLRGRGTTGYFGRQGMRISGLNVPTGSTLGLAASALGGLKGSFA